MLITTLRSAQLNKLFKMSFSNLSHDKCSDLFIHVKSLVQLMKITNHIYTDYSIAICTARRTFQNIILESKPETSARNDN
jgi:hypothetical protein